MGTTVLNGTSWPLNRQRMSDYLGFKAPVENAYDAGQFKSNDETVELASVLTSIALHVATFIEDLSVQYAQPRPWILLQEGGENTYGFFCNASETKSGSHDPNKNQCKQINRGRSAGCMAGPQYHSGNGRCP